MLRGIEYCGLDCSCLVKVYLKQSYVQFKRQNRKLVSSHSDQGYSKKIDQLEMHTEISRLLLIGFCAVEMAEIS